MKKVLVLASAAAVALGLWAQETAVYRRPGSPLFEAISQSIIRESAKAGLGTPAGPVDVKPGTAGALKDLAGLKGLKHVWAVGPDAATLAVRDPYLSGVHVFVPNPYVQGLSASSSWAGVSPYPDPRLVFRFLKTRLGVQKPVMVYTKKNTEEVARIFEAAAREEKVSCTLAGLAGPEDLQAALGPALASADAVLLPMDAIAFSSDAVRFIVTSCLEQKKPVVGFLQSITQAGVALALYAPPEEIGRAACAVMQELRQKGGGKKVYHPVRFKVDTNAEAAKQLGLKVASGEEYSG